MHRFRTYTKLWIKQESKPEKKARTRRILSILQKKYPAAKIMLRYSNTIQLMVAVMLSAQCTDKKVNEVTKVLFKKYKTVDDFADADLKTFELEIRQTGFYHAKAKNIIAAAQKIRNNSNGKFPRAIEEAITLPGIGRKSANVIIGNAYGIIEGIAVDTHVGRLAQRWGLTASDNPIKIEQDLMRLVPEKDWLKSTYLTIEHGRAICAAQRRKCEMCPLKNICPSSLV